MVASHYRRDREVCALFTSDFHQQWRLLNGDYINGEASLTAGPLWSTKPDTHLFHKIEPIHTAIHQSESLEKLKRTDQPKAFSLEDIKCKCMYVGGWLVPLPNTEERYQSHCRAKAPAAAGPKHLYFLVITLVRNAATCFLTVETVTKHWSAEGTILPEMGTEHTSSPTAWRTHSSWRSYLIFCAVTC